MSQDKGKARFPEKTVTIFEDMVKQILAGEWGKSGIIPPRTELAKQYHVSTSTINDVYNLLHSQGYVLAQGRNVVVNPHRFSIPALVPSFDHYLREQGIEPYMENYGTPEIIELSKDLAKSFDLMEGMKALRRTRIQGEQGKRTSIPYRITETYYPLSLVESDVERIKTDAGFVAIDAIATRTGLHITNYDMTIETRIPSHNERELLQVTLYTSVNEIYRKCYAPDKTLIMFSKIVTPGYRFRFQMEGVINLDKK